MDTDEKDTIIYKCLFPPPKSQSKQTPGKPQRLRSFFEAGWPDDLDVMELYTQNIISIRFLQLLEKDTVYYRSWAREDWIYFCPSLLREIVTHAICPFCGVLLNRNNVTLDRIDDTQPWRAHNVHLVCNGCKDARSQRYSPEEFKKICLFLLNERKLPVRPEMTERAFMPLTKHFDNEKWTERKERCYSVATAKIQKLLLSRDVITKIRQKLQNRDLTPAEQQRIKELLQVDPVSAWVNTAVRKTASFTPHDTYEDVHTQEFYTVLLKMCMKHIFKALAVDIPELLD